MTSVEEIARLLGRSSIFSSLSERDLSQLAEVAVPRAYLGGESIFREGDSGDTCYVVRSGRVRVTRRHSDGRVLTLAELGSGQMFGELAMFDGETRSASVEAIEDTRALALLAGDLRRLLLNPPELPVKTPGGIA